MELLDVATREDRGWTVVVARGQLDVATAPRFRQVLVESQYRGANDLLVDLCGIEFLDSFGLGVLVGALKRARTHDARLVLVCCRPRTRQLLELTGLNTVFEVVEDQESVLAAARPTD